ncbi:Ku protein [Reyranella sp.]|uniref:non-homologous end joining protein Ku n=1 Tax=Reyranella sp. TaxID=1929291 RepID=UPI003BA9F794
MPRSSWKGYLKLSLVSCAVALYNATSASERVAFNTLNRKTGNRLKQNLVDSVSGDPVDTADRVKGYQVAKGQYVMVEDDELEAVKLESTKTIEIETFVPAAEIDDVYLDNPYYLAPDDKVAEEAFAVIREAMTRKKMVGIGRIVLARRERMLMLQPRGKGMQATTLRYPYEVRQDGEIFGEIGDVKLPAEMLDIAQEIINRMSGHFQPDRFSDRYEEAVVALLRAKQAGESFVVPEPSQPANVVNIMDALKKSLEAAGGEGALRRPRAPSKKAAEAPAKGTARKPTAKKAPARKAARG